MQKTINEIVKEYAKSMSILVVDDEDMLLDVYARIFKDIFFKVDTASNGLEAYDKWVKNNDKYDIVITDIIMPKMDGFELIKKIRLKSHDQRIIILSAMFDMNEMRDIISLGIDGIMLKPYDHEAMFQVLERVLKIIHNAKMVNMQLKQLKLMAKDNVDLKASIKKVEQTNPNKKPTSANKSLENKYSIRDTLKGTDSQTLVSTIDYYDMDKIELFQDNLEKYESIIYSLASSNASQTKEQLGVAAEGLNELINLLNNFGVFSVTINATENLVAFIKNIDEKLLEDIDKKELLEDTFLAILEDLNNWIDTVFVKKEAANINYFDASFANTCLELESIFTAEKLEEEEESLEFF